jgi:hypothetical protein
MIVPLIAQEDLTAEAKKGVQELLSVQASYFPQTSDFIRASVWPDTLRQTGLTVMSSGHYISLTYDPTHLLKAEELSFLKGTHHSEIVFALTQCQKTLLNPQAGQWEKAFALRWVIHLVGDIHQPLHCTTFYSLQFPKGDIGGNSFLIESPYKNLHMLWDAACGALPSMKYTDYKTNQNDASSEGLRKLAQEWRLQYPREQFSELSAERIETWAEESHQLAIDCAYMGIKPKQAPTQEYLERSQEVAIRRLTLAGYRLADILNEAFCPHPNPVDQRKP